MKYCVSNKLVAAFPRVGGMAENHGVVEAGEHPTAEPMVVNEMSSRKNQAGSMIE